MHIIFIILQFKNLQKIFLIDILISMKNTMKKIISKLNKRAAMISKTLLFSLLLIAAYLVSRHVLQFVLIDGRSMEPTYHSMQLVMINKLNRSYERGDVICFYSASTDSILIKRIIGMPGDTVQITNNLLCINEKPYYSYDALNTQSVRYDSITYAGIAENKLKLDNTSYFVLGDNLSESKDSRYDYIGCISSTSIYGKVIPSLPLHSQ